MRDVGALHMDVRRADTFPSSPCFLISLRAPSHFPFTLGCRHQRWDLMLRARTIVMQTACRFNRLPHSTIHARTQSLTLERPTAFIHSFIFHQSHFSPSSIDLSWPLTGTSWCQWLPVVLHHLIHDVHWGIWWQIQAQCFKCWLITLGGSRGKSSWINLLYIWRNTAVPVLLGRSLCIWSFAAFPTQTSFFFFFPPSDMNEFVIENSMKGFSRSSSTRSHHGGWRATRRSP